MKVCVVITARPSYSRIKSALEELRARPSVDLQIIAAASALVSRYGRIADQIQADGFRVAETISSVVDGDTLADSSLSTGLLLTQLSGAFERLKPDVVVSIADRHETIATAIAASYQHIKLAHIQGGEVTGSIDDKVRNAVTQLADVHCVASEAAAARVKAMKPGAEVHVTGCPSLDIAKTARTLGNIRDHWPSPQIMVLQHSVTGEHDQAVDQIKATIEGVRLVYKEMNLEQSFQPVYLWPGEDAGGRAMAKYMRQCGIEGVDTYEPIHFLQLLDNKVSVLVGNSSVGIRECAFLGVPVVNIGTRQQGRERGPNVIDVPHDPAEISKAIQRQLFREGKKYPPSLIYGNGWGGRKIANVLAGHVHGTGVAYRSVRA